MSKAVQGALIRRSRTAGAPVLKSSCPPGGELGRESLHEGCGGRPKGRLASPGKARRSGSKSPEQHDPERIEGGTPQKLLLRVRVRKERRPQKLSLKGGNSRQRNLSRTFYGAGTGIRTMPEALPVHLGDHFQHAGAAFSLTLR